MAPRPHPDPLRRPRPPYLALLAAALLCSNEPAEAQPAPEAATADVGWDNVLVVAEAAFERGPGLAERARGRGLGRAARRVAGRWESLQLDLRHEQRFEDPSPAAYEASIDVGLQVRLGSGPSARREGWLARRAEQRARVALRRWRFVQGAVERLGAWWLAHLHAEHLREQRRRTEALMEPLREAVRAHRLPRTTWEAMEVELARLRADEAEAAVHLEAALAELQAWLGQPVRPQPPPAAEIAPGEMEDDPWAAVLEAVREHPQLRLSRRLERRLRQEAAVGEAGGAPALSLGVGLRREGAGVSWPAVQVGLQLPLANPGAAEASRLRAEAEAEAAERAWWARRLRWRLLARARRWRAERRRLLLLRSELLEPLRRRLRTLRRALPEGRASLLQLVQARRDLLEARHRADALLAWLRTEALQARALARWLRATSPGGPR